MIPELQHIMDTGSFEDDGWVELHTITWKEDRVTLFFDVDSGVEDAEHLSLTIESVGPVAASRFHDRGAGDISIFDDHVLLWPYHRPQCDLFFRGNVPDPHSLLGALFETHASATHGWFTLDDFEVQPDHLPRLLGGGYGKLAAGPDVLIEQYAEVLKRYGVEPSILTPRPPKLWDGQQWVEGGRELRVLVFGKSYCVASGFTVSQV